MNGIENAVVASRGRSRRRKGPAAPGSGSASREARLRMAAVLEVLGGYRSPTDAAKSLGVSVPQYYKLEQRALEGMLRQCESRGRGRRTSPEREMGKLRRELARVEQELSRSQALARAARRAVGLTEAKSSSKQKDARGRKKRRPAVRALKAAAILRDGTREEPAVVQTANESS